MKVLKFGGTSVGSARQIKEVARLINNGERKIVVLSAMAGTTNTLVEICDSLYRLDQQGAEAIVTRLRRKYDDTVVELYATDEYADRARGLIRGQFAHISAVIARKPFTPSAEKEILARGELLSTGMMHLYLAEQGVRSVILPALDYMRTDEQSEPDNEYIRTRLQALLDSSETVDIYLTEGYICLNAQGGVDNLQRGGSDYTASLVGAAVDAAEIQIWTDIDGMHNNDPRFVDKTSPVRRLNFDEAAELAYFGAKILHPTCILPAKRQNIPVRLLNTMNPAAAGTLISNESEKKTIKAIAAKDNITAIKIKSTRMLLATGFLRKVFETFEVYKTPVDMVTTSEVGVSVTIDNNTKLDAIVEELQRHGDVTVDHNMVIICIAGDLQWENTGFAARIVAALTDIQVRMISYGGSNYNLSLLVRADDKQRTLQALSHHLFNHE